MAKGGLRFLARTTWSTDSRQFLLGVLGYLLRGGPLFAGGQQPAGGHQVPTDAFGICVATAEDPAVDDYVLARLRELGINNVRLSFAYSAFGGPSERLLQRLLAEQFQVLLSLVQPLEAAARMPGGSAQADWEAFVARVLAAYGSQVSALEIGATVNRQRWAGYSLDGFLAAWETAARLVRAAGVRLAGPNISDFEPLYTVGLLQALARKQQLPDSYTNNLFVERAIEPERYDRRVLGRLVGSMIKYNLVKKARHLQRLAARHDIHSFWNTYVAWTLPRIARRLPNTEDKMADYLARYLVLAAASGAMAKTYWGPLISAREGLIDDPQAPNPLEELVTWYHGVAGPAPAFRIRPGFNALRQVVSLLPGSRYLGALSTTQDLEVHAFIQGQTCIHVLWTMNAQVALLSALYPDGAHERARSYNRDGELLPRAPLLIRESPCYLLWDQPQSPPVDPAAALLPGVAVSWLDPDVSYFPFAEPAAQPRWRGLIAAGSAQEAALLATALHPDRIMQVAPQGTLRRARNAIWKVADPRDPQRLLVIKQPVKLRLHKRLLERFKPSKALRSWSGAMELLRLGIPTPRPVAYFERADGPGLTENWYVCEYAAEPMSAREFFAAYATGAQVHKGYSLEAFLQALVPFVANMHGRGIFFRDLSGGNVLVMERDGKLEFSLIDTARLHASYDSLTLGQRLSDLKRLCHKLHWAGRERFLTLYFGDANRALGMRQRLPFYLYDLKAAIKRKLRG